jgi:glyoxylase-like metal-dependent hydrolase (beta-lactamase superfamily II)
MVARITLGQFEVYSFVENRMHLDGGAMFGLIPKKMWTREQGCDENNLVPLDLNLLLIKAHGKSFLVDTGCGDVGTEKEQKIYGLHTHTQLEQKIAVCGLSPDAVDFVIFSHLHYDHSGGGLKRDPDGRIRTRFPNARYIVNRIEWEDANHPNERTTAAYIPPYIAAYRESGQVDVVEGTMELYSGITLRHTGGHTAGHQAVIIASDGKAIGYYADIFPTATHLKTAWVAAVDTHPLDSLKVKKTILKACVDNSICLAFDHDTNIKIGRVSEDNGRFSVAPLDPHELEVLEA